SSVGAAARYELHVQNVTTGEVLVSRSDLTTPQWQASGPLSGGFYSYSVRAIDAAGQPYPWSSPKSFSVDQVTPTITGPTSADSEHAPLFTWTAVGGASRYELQVDDMSTGATVLRQT